MCQPQTMMNSSIAASTGENSQRSRADGSNRVPDRPMAIDGAASATTLICTIMCAVKEVAAMPGSAPPQTSASTASPARRTAIFIVRIPR